MDTNNFNTILENFKSLNAFETFLTSKKMTWRTLKTSNPNIYVYTIKYPTHTDESMFDIDNTISNYLKTRYNIIVPSEAPDENDMVVIEKTDLFDHFGRGLILRVDVSDVNNTKYSLIGCPIPFSSKDFMSTNNDLKQCIASFIIDGTGITVCKDTVENKLLVSTRSVSGYYPDGPTNNYGNPNYSYGKMFRETLQENPTNEQCLLNLDPNYILHFVLEHPQSFKVVPCQTAHLTLVNVFKFDGNQLNYVNVSEFQKQFGTNFNEVTTINLGENPEHTINNIIETSLVPGIKLFNPTTQQWSPRLYTKSFMLRKQLRGNSYNQSYNIIKIRHISCKIYDLCASGKIILPDNYESPLHMYLMYYPENIMLGNMIKMDIYNFTNDLLHYYLNKHVKCIIKDDEGIPYEFLDLVKSLHLLYKSNMYLFKTKQINYVPQTNNLAVSSFVNLMHPARLYNRLIKYVSC